MAVEGRTKIPVVDREKCTACAACFRGCPAEVIPEMRLEAESLRGRIYKEVKTAPSINVDKVFAMPACQSACPIHQDVRGFINLVASNRYREAMELIRETNALPSVTAYVCNHPCEAECTRSLIDDPVSVKALKRFIVNFDVGKQPPAEASQKKGGKVSIVGSGPAGLAAAYDLLRMGYYVEVIEAFPEPGGMLRWVIPPFRLPRNILNQDIKYILEMGVVIKTNVKFGIDVSLSDIRKGGADVIIMAIGTHESLKLRLKNGRRTMRYMDCLTFLRRYANGEQVDLGDETVVIGAGNAGIDSARSALRCGAKKVTIVDVLSCEEIAADRDELKEAQAEGVKIIYSTMPVRIIKEDGEIRGLKCVRTELGEPDRSGQRKPVSVSGSKFVIGATSVISAIGQQPDLSWDQQRLPFNFSSKNTFIVDDSGLSSIEGVFAAGDAVNGPTTVVKAMASGKKVAKSVNAYLSGTEQR
jgi:heterodisulfide reductase subunit A